MLLGYIQQRGELQIRNEQKNKPKLLNKGIKNNKENPQKLKYQKDKGSIANFPPNFSNIVIQFYNLQDLFGLHLLSTIQDDQVFALKEVHNSFVQSKLFDHLGITQELLDLWLTRIEQIYIQNEILIFVKRTSKNTKDKFQLSPYWKKALLKNLEKGIGICFSTKQPKRWPFEQIKKVKGNWDDKLFNFPSIKKWFVIVSNFSLFFKDCLLFFYFLKPTQHKCKNFFRKFFKN